MLRRIRYRLRRFRQDEAGSIIAETVIMFPTLFAAVLATFVFFDAFRNQAIILKANYTIGDSVSRTNKDITNTYMVNMWRLHRFLTDSPTLTELRISVITYDADTDKHTVAWSRSKGGGEQYSDVPITTIGLDRNQIPIMPPNETLIVVQTTVDYQPGFSIGFGSFEFQNVSYTRPRGPQNVCYNHNGTGVNSDCPLGD